MKIGRGGEYVALAAVFCGGKYHFPEKKSLPCRFHDRNPKASSEICKGWQWSLLPRPLACQKDFFDRPNWAAVVAARFRCSGRARWIGELRKYTSG